MFCLQMVCVLLRVKQKSIGAISSHVWKLPLLVNFWLTVTAAALTTAVHKQTNSETSLVPFFAATLIVLLCPLSLVWLKLAARYHKPLNATGKQSRPPPLDGGSRGPTCKHESKSVLVVHVYSCPSPCSKVLKTVVCVLVILAVLFLLLLLAGDVERNPGPLNSLTLVTEDKVDQLAVLLDAEAANWYLFLGGLGLSDGNRNQIQQQSKGEPNMSQYCLTKGLHYWVKCANSPTYEKVIEVLNSVDKPLAKQVEEFASNVAKSHPMTVNHDEEFFDAVEIQLDECESFSKCRKYLQECYKAQTIAPAEDTKWPPTPSKHYINLAYISKKETTREKAYEFTKSTIDGEIDDIIREKKEMNMREIAQLEPDGSYTKLVLVEGAPGVGKTTFSWELCRRWAEGELLQHYILVVVLRCRDERVREAKTIEDLLFRRKHKVIDAVLQDMDTNLGRGVLIIIEGYDELPLQLRKSDSVFLDLINGLSLPCATVLVTSRPSASGELKYKKRITQHIEILGFTKKQLQLYLQSVTTKNDCIKLEQSLKLRPQIHAAMYIPLNAAIVVLVYQERGDLPETMTELYESLTQSILLRYLYGCSEIFVLEEFGDLPPKTYEQFLRLCKLAYDGICNNQQLIFSKSDVPKDFETLGFMQSVTELYVSKGAVVSYNFLHLTIQEFLAAFHIFKQFPEQWTEHFGKEYESHFKVVLRFLAGLTKLKDVDIVYMDKHSSEDAAVIHYKYCFMDYGTPTISLDIMHWLFEVHDPAMVELNVNVRFDLDCCKMPLDYYALGYCLRSYANWNLGITRYTVEEDLELLALGYNAGNSKGRGEGVTCTLETQSFERPKMLQHLFKILSLRSLEIDELVPGELHLLPTHNLEALKVGQTFIHLNDVFKTVSMSHTLKVLDLSGHSFSPSHITYLASILTQNQSLAVPSAKMVTRGCLHLTDLKLLNCTIDKDDILELLEALNSVEHQTVSKLNLSLNPFGDPGATGMAKLLANSSSTLIELRMASSHITPQGGVEIAQALCTNTTLKILDMSWNVLNMDTLATILEHNSSLTHLEMYNCDIIIQGLDQLHKLMCSNTNSQLAVVDLRGNRVTSDVTNDVFQLYKPEALRRLYIGSHIKKSTLCFEH